MTLQGSGGLAERNGPSDPMGLGRHQGGRDGARGSHALIFEEPREATAGLPCGDVRRGAQPRRARSAGAAATLEVLPAARA